MKFAFSTLACPTWGYKDIVATAKDLGFDGIEIRGIAGEMYAPKMKVFRDNLEESMAKLESLEIPMLTSNCCVANSENVAENLAEGRDYIDLAEKIGAIFVRIMPTNSAMLDGGDFDLAVDSYGKLCDYAKAKGVTPLIESNGMFANTAVLNKFMQEVNRTNMGVLWDIHHPYRYNNESIATTIANIGKYVKYVHIKDSVRNNDITEYKMLGYGDLPLSEAIAELKKIGYAGYITLEWVKRWNPNLEEPGVVLAHFINKIKTL